MISSSAPAVVPSSLRAGPGAVSGMRPPRRSSTATLTNSPANIRKMPIRRPMDPSTSGWNR
ncbi:Uncharacterised protein [Mycobacteroides abscessus subsp. abscessus]|nr:Uncharacterised protein [Mycobacteroides abscessus subsp. abscessus]